MNPTDAPEDIRGGEGPRPPDFDDWRSPEELLKGGPPRERLYGVVLGLREPTEVSVVAERAGWDTETAREYLDWFAELRLVREHEGEPVRYERNEAYFRWRRIDRIRERRTDAEIADLLAETVAEIERYRDRFDASTPEEVSLAAASERLSTADAWEALSEWKTLVRRAELLAAAHEDDETSAGRPERREEFRG